MRSDLSRLVVLQAIGAGLFAFIAATLGSEGLNDLAARLVLIVVFSFWVAVGSGITAFLLLNVEGEEARK